MNRDAKFLLRISILILFVIVICGYAYYQARKIIDGPQIKIDSPTNGEVFNTSFIDIKGNAQNITSISLDDRPILIDQNGNFDEKLLLPPGYTIIDMKAEDRFSRNIEKTLEVYYQAPQITATTSSSTTASSSNSQETL